MSIYDHFRKEEHPFIDQVLEWKEVVKDRFIHKLTDFLDPRQQQIIAIVIGQDADVHYSFHGGSSHAERKRLLLYPSYFVPETDDYQLAAYQIHYPQKFVELSHRELLGSLMSLGLKRDKFGDIYIQDENIQILVASEVNSFVEANLQSVGRVSVQLERIALSDVVVPKEEWHEMSITASSLRLDVILSEVYKMSRSKITPFIDNNRVKVNWKVVEQASYQLQSGDFLSVRGLGRSKIIDILGKTKKDKWRINVGLRK